VSREPQFTVAVYSALLMASVEAYGDSYNEDRNVLPSWREKPQRPSCRMLMKELYHEIYTHPEKIIRLKLTEEMVLGIMRKVS
jgi:hypothetical protein